MKNLIDVVNFNADASCLSSKRWLDILKGGSKSSFIEWLNLFIDIDKKVVLGFTGASIVDIAVHNPEAIDLINKNANTFEIILRAFSHDIALLRSEEGFATNFKFGYKVISKEFINISKYFLPPEFMLTSNQISQLHKKNVVGLFINSESFSKEVRSRIPSIPYRVKGLFGIHLNCIPFSGGLTRDYLNALHKFDCRDWNKHILASNDDTIFSWRDGESMSFIPDGLTRETFWLKNEDKNITRKHTKNLKLEFISNECLDDYLYKSYPVHSFSAWMKEFRMLGFVNKVSRIEESLQTLEDLQRYLWLMVINSDILSAIEKRSPVVQMRKEPSSDKFQDFTIHRSERGFEGEEYLAIMEAAIMNESSMEYIYSSQEPHIVKLRARIEYLSNLKISENCFERKDK